MKIVILNFSTHLDLSKNIVSVLENYSIDPEIIEVQYSHDIKSLPELIDEDIVWINTTSRNLNFIDENYLENLWDYIRETNSYIIQNNFEPCKHTKTRHKVNDLNSFIDLRKGDRFFVLDINFIF